MSDTPETDYETNYRSFGFYTMGGIPADVIGVEFARNLERERDAVEQEVADVRDVLLDAMPHIDGSTKKLAELLVAERDELRKALSLAGKRCQEVHHPKSMQHGDLDPCPVEALIQQALNKTL